MHSYLLFDFEFEWESKQPGEPFRRAVCRAFHPDQSLLGKKFASICVVVDLRMCHLEADTAPVQERPEAASEVSRDFSLS